MAHKNMLAGLGRKHLILTSIFLCHISTFGDLIIDSGTTNVISVTQDAGTNVRVGQDTENNMLVITNGATLSSTYADVGRNGTSHNNAVRVESNSTWMTTTEMNIGNGGETNRLDIMNGGSVISSNNLHIGRDSSSLNNTVVATGDNASISALNTLVVGRSGTDNVLSLHNGASGYAGAYLVVGDNGGANNNIINIYTSSVFTVGTEVRVGQDGGSDSNQINIQGAGAKLLSQGDISINRWGESNSVHLLYGGHMGAVGNLYVGQKSSYGSLRIDTNSTVHVNKAFSGYEWNSHANQIVLDGSSALLYVTNRIEFGRKGNHNSVELRNGATITNGEQFNLGQSGSHNVLRVQTNSLVESTGIDLGQNSGADYNKIYVDGANARVELSSFFNAGRNGTSNEVHVLHGGDISVAGSLLIGDYGTYNSFNLFTNSTVSSTTLEVGRNGGADYNQLNINGANAQLDVSSWANIGRSGAHTEANLLNGGHLSIGGKTTVGVYNSDSTLNVFTNSMLTTSDLEAGQNGGASNNTIQVIGDQARIQANGFSMIGRSGSSNTLYIADGGHMYSTSYMAIGNNSSAQNNYVHLDGVGSIMTNTTLTVGNEGDNTLMEVTGGATLLTDAAVIGRTSNAENNHMTVSGSGTTWTNNTYLNISDSPWWLVSTNSSLTITDGATVHTATLGLHEDTSALHLEANSRLEITGNFDADQAGTFDFSGGTLAVHGQLDNLSLVENGRRLEAIDVNNNLTISGTFAPGIQVGNSAITGSLTMNANGLLEMQLGGTASGDYDHLSISGLSSLQGDLEVAYFNGFMASNGDSFDLFDYNGGKSGTFDSIVLPTLSGGLSWDQSNLYTDGTITVVPEPSTTAQMIMVAGGLLAIRKIFRV